ncbi:hypothetical protein J0X19_04770 [Hymenobacter sp. BT186]|uniref:Uncharacterized protein n=2 Tax=Hymenobacter telluris TaxID=2816474 RepID=A0A939EVH0_9BACT|nr:hypothetical protein [Hymenobacter telluris]MBW3373273.1 hypothetical protein [Hymenobacter norwichensis]
MKKLYILLCAIFFSVITGFISNKQLRFNVDERFSVELPNHPTSISRDTVEADGFEQHLKIFSSSDEYGLYRISRDDLNHESDNYLTPQGRKEWYSVSPMVEGAVFRAKFIKRENFIIDGIEGVDRVYELPASRQNEHTIKYVRSLLVDKVGYELWFIPKDGLKDPCINQKKRFFNSIKLKSK